MPHYASSIPSHGWIIRSRFDHCLQNCTSEGTVCCTHYHVGWEWGKCTHCSEVIRCCSPRCAARSASIVVIWWASCSTALCRLAWVRREAAEEDCTPGGGGGIGRGTDSSSSDVSGFWIWSLHRPARADTHYYTPIVLSSHNPFHYTSIIASCPCSPHSPYVGDENLVPMLTYP